MSAQPAFIDCRKVIKTYKTAAEETQALRSINFRMDRGEMVAIIGPSGAGKSTLLNLLGGLDEPDAGELYVEGMNLRALRGHGLEQYRLKRVGFIWQNVSQNLLMHRSAIHNVTLPMMLAGTGYFKRRKEAEKLLASVDLSEHMYKKPPQLSGGQQQRVAIAVALANKPDLLLADEPTGALDQKTARQVMDVLKEKQREGVTILMVTHDRELAEFYADRTLTLRDGLLGQDMESHLNLDGSLSLPDEAKLVFEGASGISVEVREGGDGVLLRPRLEEDDKVEALLQNLILPKRRSLWQRLRGKE